MAKARRRRWLSNRSQSATLGGQEVIHSRPPQHRFCLSEEHVCPIIYDNPITLTAGRLCLVHFYSHFTDKDTIDSGSQEICLWPQRGQVLRFKPGFTQDLSFCDSGPEDPFWGVWFPLCDRPGFHIPQCRVGLFVPTQSHTTIHGWESIPPPKRWSQCHATPNAALQCVVLIELTSNIVPHSCSGIGPLLLCPEGSTFSLFLLSLFCMPCSFTSSATCSPHLIWLKGVHQLFFLQLQNKCMFTMWNFENKNAQNIKITLGTPVGENHHSFSNSCIHIYLMLNIFGFLLHLFFVTCFSSLMVFYEHFTR